MAVGFYYNAKAITVCWGMYSCIACNFLNPLRTSVQPVVVFFEWLTLEKVSVPVNNNSSLWLQIYNIRLFNILSNC